MYFNLWLNKFNFLSRPTSTLTCQTPFQLLHIENIWCFSIQASTRDLVFRKTVDAAKSVLIAICGDVITYAT